MRCVWAAAVLTHAVCNVVHASMQRQSRLLARVRCAVRALDSRAIRIVSSAHSVSIVQLVRERDAALAVALLARNHAGRSAAVRQGSSRVFRFASLARFV